MTNTKDEELLQMLLKSLENWAKKTKNKIRHERFEKETGTLYRFGLFYVNGYKYSISGWVFNKNIVTFENEKNGSKVKFDIDGEKIIYSFFVKDGLLVSYKKGIKNYFSRLFGELSDKLRT